MTRRRLAPDEKAYRQDVHLYRKQAKIITLAIEKHRLENPSAVVRTALEYWASQKLVEDMELDDLAEKEKDLERFRQEHNGNTPSQVMAQEKVEAERLKAENAETDKKSLAAMYTKLKDIIDRGRGSVNIHNFAEANIQNGIFTFNDMSIDEVAEHLEKRHREGCGHEAEGDRNA